MCNTKKPPTQKDCQYYSENNQHVFLLPRTEISVRFLCGPGCPDLSPDRVAVCDRSSHPLLNDPLLLGPQRKKTLLALALSRRSRRHHLLAPRLTGSPPLSPFLQRLFLHLRLSRSCHHPSHVVLHYGFHDLAGCRDQQRDRSSSSRNTPHYYLSY